MGVVATDKLEAQGEAKDFLTMSWESSNHINLARDGLGGRSTRGLRGSLRKKDEALGLSSFNSDEIVGVGVV